MDGYAGDFSLATPVEGHPAGTLVQVTVSVPNPSRLVLEATAEGRATAKAAHREGSRGSGWRGTCGRRSIASRAQSSAAAWKRSGLGRLTRKASASRAAATTAA